MTPRDEHDQNHEGPEAAKRFERLLGRVVKVSKEELQKREAEYKQRRKDEKSKPTEKSVQP
jgi:hypothetical protein